MTKYPTYKDSGIEWLGQIPTHWDLLRNKIFITEHDNVVGQDAYKYTLLSLTKQGVIQRDIESGKGKFPKEYDNYKIVESGNIIFCLFDVDETPRTVGLSSIDGMITGAYNVFSIKGINSQFYYYYFLAVDEAKALRPLYSGLRKVVKTERFAGLRIPVPPEEEQRQIVAYLDYKSNKIQTLSELKQAEIAAVVTRGLDPNVPMKESGIEWIGQIPAHWEITQLRKYLRLFSDKGHPDMDLLSVTREQGVIVRDITSKEENHNFIQDDLSGYKLIQKGQFAINKMKAWQGSYGVSKYKGIVSPAYYTCELNNIDTEYFDVAIRSQAYIGFFTKYSKGIRSGQWDLSPDALKSIPFVEPPIVEQRAIVSYITDISEKIDSYITKLKEEINYLQEYKQRLISDVVTGKVDVRGVEIPNEE